MYIPSLPQFPRGSSPSSRHSSSPGNPLRDILDLWHLPQWTHTHTYTQPQPPSDPFSGPSLRTRAMDSMQSRDITIGVIVGVVLLVFLAGLFFFLYRYHASIRLIKKRRHRRYGSRSGGSSKGSHSTFSGGSDGAPPPPPPPPGA